MSYVDLSKVSNWLNVINKIPSLVETTLLLEDTYFKCPIPRTIRNSTKLKYVDLSGSNPNSAMLKWLYNCTSLETLLLYNNPLHGASAILDDIILQLGVLKNLQALSGSIPTNIGRLSSLEFLGLSDNKLHGSTLLENLGQLSKLEILDISSNSVEGIVTETQLDNLTHLRMFVAFGNSLTLNVSSSWIPRTQFRMLSLGSWQLVPEFQTWLQSPKTLVILDLSSTGISGTIPSWFWNLSMQFGDFNLSHNQLHGEISSINGNQENSYIDLNSNKFNGTLPLFISPAYSFLDLSNNSFSGGISHFLCDEKSENKIVDYRDLARLSTC
ncbi:hypothetical protein ACH5RR_009325 [Cinchona calisaya]|uniref:Disease resistance R13L4/SHOC-2-like LRR domain-containing protein n=1 Tax=Cinchona calisaya TaxID=153742 RepID=A0ABD3AFU6_9GENT